MQTTIFYILQIAVILACLALVGVMLLRGWRLAVDDPTFRQHRRMMGWLLVAVAVHSLSATFIVQGDQLELHATQPLLLLYVAFAVLTMWGSLTFGRRHHERLSTWVLLLQIPAVMLVTNVLMLISGHYRPIMDTSDWFHYQSDAPVVFAGRIVFLAITIIFWLLALGLFIEAWLHDNRQEGKAPSAVPASLHRKESRLLLFWAVVLVGAIVPFCQKTCPPHFVKDTLFIIAVLWMTRVYQHFAFFARERLDGSLTGRIIAERLPAVLALEHGGTTPWGSYMPQNPFYGSGNPVLDEIAAALAISRDELSQYIIQTLKTNLVAWSSVCVTAPAVVTARSRR